MGTVKYLIFQLFLIYDTSQFQINIQKPISIVLDYGSIVDINCSEQQENVTSVKIVKGDVVLRESDYYFQYRIHRLQEIDEGIYTCHFVAINRTTRHIFSVKIADPIIFIKNGVKRKINLTVNNASKYETLDCCVRGVIVPKYYWKPQDKNLIIINKCKAQISSTKGLDLKSIKCFIEYKDMTYIRTFNFISNYLKLEVKQILKIGHGAILHFEYSDSIKNKTSFLSCSSSTDKPVREYIVNGHSTEIKDLQDDQIYKCNIFIESNSSKVAMGYIFLDTIIGKNPFKILNYSIHEKMITLTLNSNKTFPIRKLHLITQKENSIKKIKIAEFFNETYLKFTYIPCFQDQLFHISGVVDDKLSPSNVLTIPAIPIYILQNKNVVFIEYKYGEAKFKVLMPEIFHNIEIMMFGNFCKIIMNEESKCEIKKAQYTKVVRIGKEISFTLTFSDFSKNAAYTVTLNYGMFAWELSPSWSDKNRFYTVDTTKSMLPKIIIRLTKLRMKLELQTETIPKLIFYGCDLTIYTNTTAVKYEFDFHSMTITVPRIAEGKILSTYFSCYTLFDQIKGNVKITFLSSWRYYWHILITFLRKFYEN